MTHLENKKTATDRTNDKTTAKKGKKKPLVFLSIILCAAIIILLGYTLIDHVNDIAVTNRVQSYLNGKIFIENYESISSEFGFVRIYAFNEDSLCTEQLTAYDKSVFGDLNDAHSYKINASLTDGKMRIEYKTDNGWCTGPYIALNVDGSVEFLHGDWNSITLDKVKALKKKMLCEHKFDSKVITKSATCTSEGVATIVCSKCSYMQKETVSALGHNYQNKLCTRCGEKKTAPKSNLLPNVWYTYDNVLRYQNAKITSAVVTKKYGISVSYNFVCQKCHAIDPFIEHGSVKPDNSIWKPFYCYECGEVTTVNIRVY